MREPATMSRISTILPDRTATPELDLLVLCADSRPDAQKDARLRALFGAAIDWDAFVRLAWLQHLIPLLIWHIERLGVRTPEWVAKHLQETQERNAARGRQIVDRLVALVASLKEAGVPTIAFKGPTLEQQAYSHAGLRGCGDLDFLFHEKDMPRALSLFRTFGYRTDDSLTRVEERVFFNYHFAHELVDPSAAANIDAHWRLLPSTWSIPLDYDGFWSRSHTIEIAGQPVRMLCDEDLLFYLAVHGTKEKWVRLRMVCDVAELLRARPALDWDRAFSLAARQGGRRILLLAAYLATTWLGAPLPHRVLDLARGDRWIRRTEIGLWRDLQRDTAGTSLIFDLSLFRLLALDRVTDRIAYLVRTIGTPRLVHTQVLRLPEPLIAGYVPLKVIYDYMLMPAWRISRRLRTQPTTGGSESGAR